MTDKNSHPKGTVQHPKRKRETNLHAERPSKKLRIENELSSKSFMIDGDILPNPIPKLPSISPEYERIVFTHPSVATPVNNDPKMVNYDRLEFLGDAYIEIIASRLIFDNYATVHAGGMSRMRESVVKNETLSKYSIMYGFDKKLRITQAEPEGGKGWTKIYGDVFEAFAAAVVLSEPKGGEARLEAWLRALWKPILRKVKITSVDTKAKEELAKKIKHNNVYINYVEERPPVVHKGEGRETYFIGVYLTGWGWNNQHLGSGQGSNKVHAGQEAAAKALDNHPLIDEVIAKREAFMQEKNKKQELDAQVEAT